MAKELSKYEENIAAQSVNFFLCDRPDLAKKWLFEKHNDVYVEAVRKMREFRPELVDAFVKAIT